MTDTLARPLDEAAALAETARHHPDVYGYLVHGYKPAYCHMEWYKRAQAVMEGRSAKRKLLILAPPGHAKSSVVSLVLPTWYLGRYPDRNILCYTSADAMANQFASLVRLTLEHNPQHQAVFPVERCRPDYDRGWSLDGLYLKGVPSNVKDPSYRNVGYMTSSIGARAWGIILDDPLTQDQASSPLVQVEAKSRHDMTVDSRLHPTEGWELAIMTRWHQGDLASHFMSEAKREEWEVIEMPAIGDPAKGQYPWGEALWPERFPLWWLEKKRRSIGGPQFNAMYQCDPLSLGGDIFRDGNWLRPFPLDFDVPSGLDRKTARQRLTKVQYWDLAYSARTHADYTVAVTMGVDGQGRQYVLNVWRQRIPQYLDPDEDIQKGLSFHIAKHIARTGPALVGIEAAAFRQPATKALVGRVSAALRKWGVAAAAIPVEVSTDKVTRAMLPATTAEGGMLYVDRGAPWFEEFHAELMGFPNLEHDDQVDALAGASQLAVEYVQGDAGNQKAREYAVRGDLPEHRHDWNPFQDMEDQYAREFKRRAGDKEADPYANRVREKKVVEV